MELIKLLIKRRSIRKFKKKSIAPHIQKEILQAGLLAPSSKGYRPWEFITIENKETLTKLSTCKEHGASFLANSALAIVVVVNTQTCDVWVEDCSIAAFSMQLAAENLGLGSCWVQIRKRQSPEGHTSSAYIKNILHVPKNYEVECVIGIGYKDQEKHPHSIEKLHWEKIHQESFENDN